MNPKRIFLLDAIGALLTALLLFAISIQFNQYFGIPKQVLYFLSGIALGLFVYSISCHHFIESKFRPFLVILMLVNATYLLISIAMLIHYSKNITSLGWIYFSLEIFIIGIIISLEYKTYSNQKV